MITILTDQLLVAGLCSFLISLVATPLVRKVARRKAALDRPNVRSSHVVAVPRVGGAAIIAGTLGGAVLAIQYLDWRLVSLGLASILLALIGFVDDVRPMGPAQKYAPQLLASCLAVIALRPTMVLSLPFYWLEIDGLPAMILGAFWIMAFVNALNFMDGIDGLAAGVGAMTAIGVLLLTAGAGAFMLIPLAAALIGFLAWNTNPASIFMGDSGSQFAGFVLAIGSLHWPSGQVHAVAVLFVFAPLLFDTGFTLLRRLISGQNIFQAHRSHLYQRLIILGYSHRAVANLYYCAAALSMIGAATYLRASSIPKLLLIVFAALLATAYVTVVGMLERKTLHWTFIEPSCNPVTEHTDSDRTWCSFENNSASNRIKVFHK